MAVFSGNGSAASPSFTFSSDTDCGLYRVGDNSIAISAAGVEKITFSAGGITVNDGAQAETFRVKTSGVSDTFVVTAAKVGILNDSPQSELFVESGTGNPPGPNILSAALAGTNDDLMGKFGFYNKATQTASEPIRAYMTATRENSNWGANYEFYASTGTTAATRRLRMSAGGGISAFSKAGDTIGSITDFGFTQFIRPSGTITSSTSSAGTVLSAVGGSVRHESGYSYGAGAHGTASFSLAASASATNIIGVTSNLGNLSNGLATCAGYLTVTGTWVGAPNNGSRTVLYRFLFNQNSFSITEIQSTAQGTAGSFTLSTSTAPGDVIFRLANDSGAYTFIGAMGVLLVGGSLREYAVTNYFLA